MPTINFEIDEATGKFSVDIEGVVGPACENVEKMIAEIAGNPATAEKKRAYYQRPSTQTRVGGK